MDARPPARCAVLITDRAYFEGLRATLNSLAAHWKAGPADEVCVIS